jgi:mRNA interferase HicA
MGAGPYPRAPSAWPRSVLELVLRTALGESIAVTGAEFIRRLRRLARKRGVAFDMDTRRGRGSHRIVYFGACRTTVKDLKEEIGKGLLRQMCNDLKIDPTDLI